MVVTLYKIESIKSIFFYISTLQGLQICNNSTHMQENKILLQTILIQKLQKDTFFTTDD